MQCAGHSVSGPCWDMSQAQVAQQSQQLRSIRGRAGGGRRPCVHDAVERFMEHTVAPHAHNACAGEVTGWGGGGSRG